LNHGCRSAIVDMPFWKVRKERVRGHARVRLLLHADQRWPTKPIEPVPRSTVSFNAIFYRVTLTSESGDRATILQTDPSNFWCWHPTLPRFQQLENSVLL
jgi:hypothetical protein